MADHVIQTGRLWTILDALNPVSSLKPMTNEPWVPVDKVALHLGVAKDTVYRWRERRNLPARRIGRLWKFKLSEVDTWVVAGGANDDTTGQV